MKTIYSIALVCMSLAECMSSGQTNVVVYSRGAATRASSAALQGTSSNAPPAVTIFRLQNEAPAGSTSQATETSRGRINPMEGVPACATPPGLVSWWRDPGQYAFDALGNNPGTLQNGASACDAWVGTGLCFNSEGQAAVEIPYSPTLALVATPSYAVEAWVYPYTQVDDPIGQAFIFGQGYGRQLVVRAGAVGLSVAFVFATDPWTFYELDSSPTTTPNGEIPVNDWTHLVGTWDAASGSLSLYINGELNAQATPGVVPWDSGCAFHIGGLYDPDGDCAYVGQFFNGIIDAASCYAVALSADDVASLYAAGSVGKCLEQPPCILTQPEDQRVPVGQNASLSVWAVGMGSLSYQWRFNGDNLAGATDSTLALTGAQLSSSGTYSVVVSSPYGSTPSDDALLTVYTPVCTEADSSLVSWWKAERNALDLLGANNTALQGGATFSPGMVGQAFDLDGSSAYVDVADSASLNPTNAITVEAWIYPRLPLDPLAAPVLKKAGGGGDSGEDDGYTLELSGPNAVRFWVFLDGGQGWAASDSAPLRPSRWSHLAGVYDGSTLSFYLNGVLVGTPTAAPGHLVPSGNNLQIGHDPSNRDRYFNGLIDEASVYSTALSAAQIQAIYEAGVAGKCPPDRVPSITSQPSSQTVARGANVTFSVAATASLPLGYQWMFNGTNIAGATASSYTRSNVQTTDAGSYAVLVRSFTGQVVSGQVMSDSALLTVVIPPAIITQPASQTVSEGNTVTFNVEASGSAPLAYQWTLNGADILGATASTFTAEDLEVSASGGVYVVRVANAGGTAASTGASLTVLPCDPTARPLAVNAWKMSCEDKFWLNVTNLTASTLTAGRFDLFVYFDGATRTFYRNLQPWGTSDALPPGTDRLFTFCNPDHTITNYDCVVVYRGGGNCAASPRFRIATREALALVMQNTTLMTSPAWECNPQGSRTYVSPSSRSECTPGSYSFPPVVNCQPNPCGTWPDFSTFLSANGGSPQLDNFYEASDPLQMVPVGCPKSGFKNVYAIKAWHGAWGPMSSFWSALGQMKGDCNCQTPPSPQTSPDTTKYLHKAASASWSEVSVGHGGSPSNSWAGSESTICQVGRYSGKLTVSTNQTGDKPYETWPGLPDITVSDLPNIYCAKVTEYAEMLIYQDLPPPGVQPTYSEEGSTATMRWQYDWDLPSSSGFSMGSVQVDLAAGTYSYTNAYREGAADGSEFVKRGEGGYITMSQTQVSRWDSDYVDAWDEGYVTRSEFRQSSGTVTYSDTYSSDDVNADCNTLLATWNLLDDTQYPWRRDGDINRGPLVTYNESGPAAPSLVAPGSDPPPFLPPWPSQLEGAILGAPLPVHGPNGELYTYASYFNFYHINWSFVDTGVGLPEPFVESHGALSPYPNATQWIDDFDAQCLPAGPFWAFGSQDGNKAMFRLKDPNLTDTTGEYEQGGMGAGCLIKCKWAETLTPATPPGSDFVFKDWTFDFRDFFESYGWNVGAWMRDHYDTTCPSLLQVTPVRFTPFIIPPEQPGAGYYIDPSRGSYWISNMTCQPQHYGYDCCRPAVYVQPDWPGPDCTNGIHVAMPPAVCDGKYGSLWMGRVDQSTSDANACSNYVGNRNNGTANPPGCDPQIDLELVWHGVHGYETFVMPLPFTYGGTAPPRLTLDLDIDSDNNNGFKPPDRSLYEDAIEDNPSRPGKIIYVNSGDADMDGIPDFADGFNLDGITGNSDDNAGTNYFVPLVLEIPPGMDLSRARLTIGYDASDPAGVTQDEDGKWWPAPGHLRIWRKNGNQSRDPRSANASPVPGDYLAPGTYTLAQLGFSESRHVITNYVEGIAASDYKADQRITAVLDPSGDGTCPVLQDAVRITVIGVEMVEALGDAYTEAVSQPLQDSHPAPYFEGGLTVNPIGDPRPNADGTRLLNTIQIAGRVRSHLCDLVPGENGKIGGTNGGVLQDIVFSLNGEPLTNGTIFVFYQPKDTTNQSFTAPYATYTDFNIIFTDVDVSTGLNWLRAAATDKVPGVGLTGFAEYSWTVTASLITPATESTEPQSPCDGGYCGWNYQNSAPALISASGGGETHAYYARFVGPSDVLAGCAADHPDKVAQGPDLLYYVANSLHIPEVYALVQLTKARALPAQDPAGLVTEQAGILYGMGAQAVDDVVGLAKLGFYINQLPEWEQRYLMAYQAVELGLANDQQYKLVVDVGTKAEELSAAAQAAWHLWDAVEQSRWNTLAAAASGEWQEAWAQSETCRWLAAYMVEAMVAINNHYVGLSPFERGKLEGRITLEAVLIIVPLTKAAQAGQASKVEMLTDLSKVQWIKDNDELLAVLNKVIDLVNGTKPPPVIAGVTPTLTPAFRVGTDLGLSSERVAGSTFAKVQQAIARREAWVDSIATLVADAGAGKGALEFNAYQKLVLSGAPPGAFASEEDAAAFLADLLTHADSMRWRDGKSILMIPASSEEEGEGWFIPGGEKGLFEANHIIKQQLQRVLRDQYSIGTVGTDAAIKNDTWVTLMTSAEHQTAETSFHIRLTAWHDNVFSDWALPYIKETPGGLYETPGQVLDEYIRFFRAYQDDYGDMISVVRAFAKIHGIPITE
jgi:hypothetical protein